MSAEEFISEPLAPLGDQRDLSAMARGEPGLPRRFRWRGGEYAVRGERGRWKSSAREGGRASGELYLRRHYYELEMDDGSCWVVYFTRQGPPGRKRKARWFLYTRRAGPG